VNLVLLDRPSASNMGSCACPPAHGPAATLGAECPVLESSAQVARRMSALGSVSLFLAAACRRCDTAGCGIPKHLSPIHRTCSFSRLQIEDLLSFTGASAGHQNHHPRGPAAVSVGPSPELQAQRDAGFAPQMAMGRNAPRYFKTKLCKFFQSVPGCPRGARCALSAPFALALPSLALIRSHAGAGAASRTASRRFAAKVPRPGRFECVTLARGQSSLWREASHLPAWRSVRQQPRSHVQPSRSGAPARPQNLLALGFL